MKISFLLAKDLTASVVPVVISIKLNKSVVLRFNTGISVKKDQWNKTTGMIIGESEEDVQAKVFLLKLEARIYEYYITCLRTKESVESQAIISLINNKVELTEIIKKKKYFLDEKDLRKLEGLSLSDIKLRIARDIFLFTCYTGMPHEYVINFHKVQVSTIQDKPFLIATTETPFPFPRFMNEFVIKLIFYWKENHDVKKRNSLMPYLSYEDYQNLLSEIDTLADLPIKLTNLVGITTYWKVFDKRP